MVATSLLKTATEQARERARGVAWQEDREKFCKAMSEFLILQDARIQIGYFTLHGRSVTVEGL